MRRLTGDQEVAGSTPAEVGNTLSWRLIMKNFSTVILSLPLIQEGQLSVSGERMCTILVNCLEDKACPVNVWLGKLTALDMTPLGWLGRKTSTQTNKISIVCSTTNICEPYTYLFKIDNCVLYVLMMNVREFYHQIHEVGISLLLLIHHLNFPKCQSVQPINFHHMAITMFLTKLKHHENLPI